MKTYYIAKEGGKQSERPYSKEEILNMLNNGVIHDNHLVLMDNGEWYSLGELLRRGNKSEDIQNKGKKPGFMFGFWETIKKNREHIGTVAATATIASLTSVSESCCKSIEKMRRKNKPAPHTEAFVKELKVLLKPRGRKTSLCLYLANGDEEQLQTHRRIIHNLLTRQTVSPLAELVFEIRAWAKANKLRGREYFT
jgi:hypothetical protein